MMASTSTEQFYRSLRERHNLLKQKLDNFFSNISGENEGKKAETVKQLQEAVNSLMAILSTQDHPGWLTALNSHLVNHRPDRGPKSYSDLLKNIVRIYLQIENQTWEYLENSDSAINFDAIFSEFATATQFQGLYDDVIALLTAMIESGRIDSLEAIAKLEALLATLKANREGPIVHKIASWKIARKYLKNLAVSIAKEFPVVKNLVEAYETTAEELDKASDQIYLNAEERVKQKLDATVVKIEAPEVPKLTVQIPRLEHKPEAPT
jgi:hypothetical protein